VIYYINASIFMDMRSEISVLNKNIPFYVCSTASIKILLTL
jgi:hypothetical protein